MEEYLSLCLYESNEKRIEDKRLTEQTTDTKSKKFRDQFFLHSLPFRAAVMIFSNVQN